MSNIVEYVRQQVASALVLSAEEAALRRRIKDNDNAERCSCWNEDRQVASAICTTCWGTGWVGGFHSLELVQIDYKDVTKKFNVTDRGALVTTTPTISMSYSPDIKQGDLFCRVELDGRTITNITERFIATSIRREELKYQGKMNLIGQIVSMAKLSPKDNLYQVPFVSL